MTTQHISKPTWHEICMNLALDLAKRATCNSPNRQVGCIIVTADYTRILSWGYNGNPAKSNIICNPLENVPAGMSRCSCIHAEANALLKLDYHDPANKVMYVTLSPCYACASLIANSGIKRIIYKEEYERDTRPLQLLNDLGIQTYKYSKIWQNKTF